MKTCSTCKQVKDLSEFGNLTSSKDGKSGRCAECLRASGKRYKQTRPDDYHLRKRESWLRLNYNITVTDYDKMVEDQGDRCGICESNDKGTNRGHWCVDHCHTSGKVRGLLCSACNKALGQLGDTKEALQKALKYLDTH